MVRKYNNFWDKIENRCQFYITYRTLLLYIDKIRQRFYTSSVIIKNTLTSKSYDAEGSIDFNNSPFGFFIPLLVQGLFCSIIFELEKQTHSFFSSQELILPVQIQVYYETLCPDSIDFISQQLYPTYQNLGKYLNIEFVPFGFASVKILFRHKLRPSKKIQKKMWIFFRFLFFLDFFFHFYYMKKSAFVLQIFFFFWIFS